MNKQAIKVSNLPKFLKRDGNGNIITDANGTPIVYDYMIVDDHTVASEGFSSAVEWVIQCITERHVWIKYESEFVKRPTIRQQIMHTEQAPKQSIFDGLNDIERRIIEEYRRKTSSPVNIFREDLPMRIVLVNPYMFDDYRQQGGRVLDPEENEKGVYEHD